MRSRLLLVVFLFAVFGAPAAFAQSYDPWRNVNERVFRFNDYFDAVLVRPVAVFYTAFVPRFMRQGIGNFFSNLNDANVFVNDLLQFKLGDAASDGGRFLVNSTVGVAGLIDVASDMGLEKNQEDFGQTFGAWGVGTGPYVVLPVFGTSTLRDSFGLVLDTLLNPIQYLDEASVRYTLFVVEEIDFRASLLSLDELVTGDRYLFYREAYLQNREYLVNDGQVEDPFGDFGEF